MKSDRNTVRRVSPMERTQAHRHRPLHGFKSRLVQAVESERADGDRIGVASAKRRACRLCRSAGPLSKFAMPGVWELLRSSKHQNTLSMDRRQAKIAAKL